MTDSTARAARYEGDSSPAPAFLWAPPDKPVSVSIPLTIVDHLEKEAVESFRSLTSRGSEIGGLLFGAFAAGTVNIEGYEGIDCEYARGPLYRLTDAEMARVERAMEERLAAGMRAVGFYRSHTRKGLSLDADDLALFNSKFPEAHHIALLIRPNATKASMAGIFIRENGKIHAEQSCLEFPFRSKPQDAPKRDLYDGAVAGPRSVTAAPAPAAARPVLRAQIVPIASRREVAADAPLPAVAPAPLPEAPEAAPEPVETRAAAPAPMPSAPEPKAAPAATAPAPAAKTPKPPKTEPPVAVSEPEAAPEKRSKLPWILLGGAATLTLAVGLIFTSGILSRKGSVPPTQDTSALALRVDRNNGDIVLTWNRDSEVIKAASRAVLSISDGPQHENVDMDLAQLRNGSIVYSPVTSDVVFKMEVTGSDQTRTTSESVRVLRTRPSPMADPNAQQAQVPAGQPAAAAPKTDAAAPAPAEPAEPAPVEEKVALAQAVKPFQKEPLATRLRTGGSSDLPDVPMIGAPRTAAPNVSVGNLSAPAPAAAPPPAAEKKPTIGGQVQQAQILKRKDPEYPRLARNSGAGGLVELVATIQVDGRVGEVKVLRGHPLLRQAAVDAVKSWIYKPAVLNGTPIETQTQVNLNFQGGR
jgi:protein TonB